MRACVCACERAWLILQEVALSDSVLLFLYDAGSDDAIFYPGPPTLSMLNFPSTATTRSLSWSELVLAVSIRS